MKIIVPLTLTAAASAITLADSHTNVGKCKCLYSNGVAPHFPTDNFDDGYVEFFIKEKNKTVKYPWNYGAGKCHTWDKYEYLRVN